MYLEQKEILNLQLKYTKVKPGVAYTFNCSYCSVHLAIVTVF